MHTDPIICDGADAPSTAFLVMAQDLRSALAEREEFVRPYRNRYDRAEADSRASVPSRVKIAEQFVRATYRADHVFGERVEEGLGRYRQLMGSHAERRS
jgi:hypothetical protein